MHTWTSEQVLALAPDSSSAAAGQGLASERKWTLLGRSERALWGLCQGSGKDPYQTRIDLSEPAFKCSCPSRKFPCKHGIGLLLLYAKAPDAFKASSEPGWVTDWLASRSQRQERKEERAKTDADKPVDAAAQAKRAEQRESRVADGIAGCRVWLEDVIRKGLASVQAESGAGWERTAARMVDAQAGGLGAFVRRLPEVLASGDGWEVRTLELLGRLHLLLEAGERLAQLPPGLAGDVRTALGWSQAKEDVLAGQGISDDWVCVGQIIEEEDRLRVRRTWLGGMKSGRRALVLDFAAGLAPLPTGLPPGAAFNGEVAFFPSAAPLRALVKSRAQEPALTADLQQATDTTFESGLARYGAALAANPWVHRWPLDARA